MTKANDLASLLDANGDVVSSALDNVPPSNDASALTTGTLAAARLPADIVVSDASPELSADLATNSNDINFGTNAKSNYGTSAQLMMYHDGSNGWIKGNNAGNNSIAIQSGGTGSVMISGSSGQNIISQQGDSAYLHYAGVTKANTTASGLTVSGDLNLAGRGAAYSLRSPDWRVYTDTNNSFVWDDYSQTRMSLNALGHLTTDGDVKTEGQVRATGWAGSPSTNASGMGVEIGMSSGIGFMLVYDRNNNTYGNFIANVNTSASIDPTAGGGQIVMNDGGFNTDFRVESDTKPYAIFVHGTTGQVGVDNNSPSSFNSLGNSSQVVIGDGTATAGVTCFSNSGNGYGHLAFADSNTSGSSAQYAGLIQYAHANNAMNFYTNANQHTVMKDGYITSRQTGNGHETVQYLRSGGTYTHVKTNIYRSNTMYYINVVGAGGYSGENTVSLLTGYAYANSIGNTSSSYHGITNLGNYGIYDVYYSSDNFLCFTISSNQYGQYTVTMASHASGYNLTTPLLIAASVGNTSNLRYYA